MRSLYRDQQGAHAVLAFATEVIWHYFVPYLDAGVEVGVHRETPPPPAT